jgi:hypothetical protein
MCKCESECSILLGEGSSFPFYKSKGRESLQRERETERLPGSCGPNGQVNDDGGAPISCLGATYTFHPNGTGGVGLSGRRTGDVRPAKMGGVSPWRVLRLHPQPGERPRRAVVACLVRGSSRRTSLPTLTLEVCPPTWHVASWGSQGPTAYGGRARPLSLGVGRGGRGRPIIIGVERGGRA